MGNIGLCGNMSSNVNIHLWDKAKVKLNTQVIIFNFNFCLNYLNIVFYRSLEISKQMGFIYQLNIKQIDVQLLYISN